MTKFEVLSCKDSKAVCVIRSRGIRIQDFEGAVKLAEHYGYRYIGVLSNLKPIVAAEFRGWPQFIENGVLFYQFNG